MSFTMLKSALRRLFASPVYAGLNILGLAVGMACCLLILLFVRHELSYEAGFSNTDRIYRVSREYYPMDGARSRVPASTNAPVAPALLEDFPEIVEVARVMGGGLGLQRGDQSFVESGLRLADAELFTIFDFEWLAGGPATALATPDSLVLTESLALKYFGRVDVLGETLRAMDAYDVRVTGVIADLPANTHLDFSGLLSLQALVLANGPAVLEQWNSSTDYHTYFLLREGVSVESIRSGIPDFMERHMGEGASQFSTLPIMNIRDIHLHSEMDEEWKETGSINTVYAF
ncbi:MAG TPA: ABC transporter permease, partial [Pseudomonadaceae bacterium]|nr:ABC transporter permease [Pseudomonadaceae bacterium]